MTETWKIKETKEETAETKIQESEIIEETREIDQVTETQTSKEGNKLDEEKDEHTQVELRGDNGVELVECFVTRCEQQDSLLKEQGETMLPSSRSRRGESGRAERGRGDG